MMAPLPLFPAEDDRPPQAARLGPRLRTLAEQGIYLGTSSWKYEGWLGAVYSRERYLTRGKFSRAKFEAECLREYAETFPVVGGDFSFYQFPTPAYWDHLFGATPAPLRFGLKVPEPLTVARWPGHARYGAAAGTVNASFLDTRLFATSFARPLAPYRQRVAALIFEFGTFARSTFPTVDDFLGRLDPFLAALPAGFRYAVEVRNPEYLTPGYFALLASHQAAHVFNAWTRMPELGDQAERPGAFTAEFTVVRALLRRGRSYEEAVRAFEPYRSVQDPNPAARDALARIADRARRLRQPAFLFVNNRLEGHAPSTIEAVAEALDGGLFA